MSRCYIDHIIVTAPSLAKGAEFVRNVLGVVPQTGGEHPHMGTHNMLLRLGDAMYLEVIAPNPAAPAPGRPRWFALDNLTPHSEPMLSAWVVRTTTDIQAIVSAASEPIGNIEPMSRGALNWLITIPDDGLLPLGGVAPALIEWHSDAHPAAMLQDQGLSLAKLELFHAEPERVSGLLYSLKLDEAPVSISAGSVPGLVAYIDTPTGVRRLSDPSIA